MWTNFLVLYLHKTMLNPIQMFMYWKCFSKFLLPVFNPILYNPNYNLQEAAEDRGGREADPLSLLSQWCSRVRPLLLTGQNIGENSGNIHEIFHCPYCPNDVSESDLFCSEVRSLGKISVIFKKFSAVPTVPIMFLSPTSTAHRSEN